MNQKVGFRLMQTLLQPYSLSRNTLYMPSHLVAPVSISSLYHPTQIDNHFQKAPGVHFGVDDKVYIYNKRGELIRYMNSLQEVTPSDVLNYLHGNYVAEILDADRWILQRLAQVAVEKGGLFEHLAKTFGAEIAQGKPLRVLDAGNGGNGYAAEYLYGLKDVFPTLRQSDSKDQFQIDLLDLMPAALRVMQALYQGKTVGLSKEDRDICNQLQFRWIDYANILMDAVRKKIEPWIPNAEERRAYCKREGRSIYSPFTIHDKAKLRAYLAEQGHDPYANIEPGNLYEAGDHHLWRAAESDFIEHINIVRGNIMDLPRDAYHMGTNYFVLCSSSKNQKDFYKLTERFVKSVKLGGVVAGVLMDGTQDWPSGNSTLPSGNVTKEMAEKAFAKAGARVKVEKVQAGGIREENEHGMLIYYGVRESNYPLNISPMELTLRRGWDGLKRKLGLTRK